MHIADLEKGIPPDIDGTFDAVLASHVLEHLARPERLLREVHQRLNPGGVLAVALPNIAHYRQRFSTLRGQFNYADTSQLDRTHLRFYTYWTAIQLLEENGYELVNTIATGLFRCGKAGWSYVVWQVVLISGPCANDQTCSATNAFCSLGLVETYFD